MSIINKEIVLECSSFIWWLDFLLFLSTSIFWFIVTIMFVRFTYPFFVIITSFFFFISLYMLFSLPRKIIIEAHSIIFIWPWKKWILSKNNIIKIKIWKYLIMTVFIVIKLKNKSFFKYVVLRFDWNLQSVNYSQLLKEIEKIGENVQNLT